MTPALRSVIGWPPVTALRVGPVPLARLALVPAWAGIGIDGVAGEAGLGRVRLGPAWQGAAGVARWVKARLGLAWHGAAGRARPGSAWQCGARQGRARQAQQARLGEAWRGLAWLGHAWHGVVRWRPRDEDRFAALAGAILGIAAALLGCALLTACQERDNGQCTPDQIDNCQDR